MVSSYAVFYHDIVQSYGSVVTRVCYNDKTYTPRHRVSNLVNGDVDLIGTFNKTWSISIVVQCS